MQRYPHPVGRGALSDGSDGSDRSDQSDQSDAQSHLLPPSLPALHPSQLPPLLDILPVDW